MNALRLACYYLRFHKAKTAILVVCIGLTIYLPLTSHWLVGEFDERMAARAGAQDATPLVIGIRGSRFDLVLHALNFRPLPEGSEFAAAELEKLRHDGLATPIPLFIHDYKQKNENIRDLVTEVDLIAEKNAISIIEDNFSNHNIYGEETGLKNKDSKYCWYIDPLDGTVNYSQGIPICAVSVGLKYNDEIIVIDEN